MRSRVLDAARDDIIRQYRFYLVDRDVPLVAARFREAVRKTLETIARSSGIGRRVHVGRTDYRSWPLGAPFHSIRVYYRVTNGRVFVVRLIHGKQRIRELLEGDE